jgi:hypothetical protein
MNHDVNYKICIDINNYQDHNPKMKTLFLTGYGLSVCVKDTRLVFKQGIDDPFGREKREVIEFLC